ncbi:superoxide dismutase family protein [Candidatus Glomeribacter gigasporarum]|nr:superoxide dismutase family protein [Candidatus Glomeribacter gigasporarum]
MKQPLLPRFFLMSLLCGASMLSSGCISGCTTLFKPYEKRARAVLLPTAGNTARGTVAFVERADGMQVSYSIQGLAANRLYGFQIHEYGNCSVRDARSAGDVFALVKRLGKSTTDDPEGRMPDIRADANGVATGFIVVSDLALDGIRSVENRSIVILRLNNEASTVARRSAPRLACGVIRPQ